MVFRLFGDAHSLLLHLLPFVGAALGGRQKSQKMSLEPVVDASPLKITSSHIPKKFLFFID